MSPSGGGTISRNLDLAYYTSGTSVTVTATPASGYAFTGWSGASTDTNTRVVIPMNGNKTLTANFKMTFTDSRDGKTYKMVVIGGQTWMAENLNHYTENDSRCFDNDNTNCTKYGRLYIWVVADTICPAGWRLPYSSDWDALKQVANGSAKKLKSKTWISYGSGGIWTDDFGFSALPGGHSGYNYASGIGDDGYWHTRNRYIIGMRYNSDSVFVSRFEDLTSWVQPDYYFCSVRCIRNN